MVTCQSNVAVRGAGRTHSLTGSLMSLALQLIEAHLGDTLRIADIARSVDLGVRRFSTLFCEATGMAPHQYVMAR